MTTATVNLNLSLRAGRRGNAPSALFAFVLWSCLAIICVFLFVILAIIIQKGLARFDADLVTAQPSKIRPQTAGVASALYGTLWVSGLTALIALPLGIGAAVYLEEYADPRAWSSATSPTPRSCC